MRTLLLSAAVAASCLSSVDAFELPAGSSQVVVGLSDSWDSSKVTLTAYEKTRDGWRQVGSAWPARLGKSGLVWGLGLHPIPSGAKSKREGDGRAPAGVFRIGGAWGYEPRIAKNPGLPYRQITARDLWVEDSESPSYNRHLVLDHDPVTAWEKKQQMRQNDPAHSLKLFIAHNAPPQVRPGAGSAIFFHIWRQSGARPTAGCTAMPEDKLRQLIAWIDPSRQPLYVLLPLAEYQKYQAAWKLPSRGS